MSVTPRELQPRQAAAASLFDDGRRAVLNDVLDRVSARFGDNKLYFAAMQKAPEEGAAPMRIPFSTIPDVAREEENDLWLQARNRFNRMSEQAHRQRRPHAPAARKGAAARPETPEAPRPRPFLTGAPPMPDGAWPAVPSRPP